MSVIGAVWGHAGLFCLACPQAGRFRIRLLWGFSFQWRKKFEQIEEGLFPITALMWCDSSNFPPYLPFPLNGPTWRFVHALSQDSLPYHRDNRKEVSTVYFHLCISDLWFNEIFTGALQILRGKVSWVGAWSVCMWGGGGGGGGLDILDTLWFSVYLSLFDLNETTGCRTDPACELVEATFPEPQKYQEIKFMFNPSCGCNLWTWASKAQRNGSIYN